jgi:hypothetical protein
VAVKKKQKQKKLNLQPPCDTATVLLGIDLGEMKIYVYVKSVHKCLIHNSKTLGSVQISPFSDSVNKWQNTYHGILLTTKNDLFLFLSLFLVF